MAKPAFSHCVVLAGLLGGTAAALSYNPAYAAAAPVALDPKEFKKFKCVGIEDLTHNTKRFTFELPNGAVPGLTVASLLMCKATVDGEEVARPYTPTTGDETPGKMDLVVKVYEQGKVSKAFGLLKVGDSMEMKVTEERLWKRLHAKRCVCFGREKTVAS